MRRTLPCLRALPRFSSFNLTSTPMDPSTIETKKLQGQLKSCKAELSKMRKQMQQLERSQNKQLLDLHGKLDELVQNTSSQSVDSYKGNPYLMQMKPIGHLESVFTEKNGTPRQGSICPTSQAKLRITWGTSPGHTLEGLEQFSHVWVVFLFHANGNVAVKAKVRPPQLLGEKKGLFSTRTPHRPNPIGLSLCKLERVDFQTVYLSGVDIIDGTPILDIKPYIPAFDNPVLHPLVQPHPLSHVTLEEKGEKADISTSYYSEVSFVKQTQSKFDISYTADVEASMDAILNENPCSLRFLQSKEEIKKALEEVLFNEPRSIYRRTKCGDIPYSFIVDNIRVICLIDNDKGTVLVSKIQKQQH